MDAMGAPGKLVISDEHYSDEHYSAKPKGNRGKSKQNLEPSGPLFLGLFTNCV